MLLNLDTLLLKKVPFMQRSLEREVVGSNEFLIIAGDFNGHVGP